MITPRITTESSEVESVRILVISAHDESPQFPFAGAFVRRQIEALSRIGHDVSFASEPAGARNTATDLLKYIALARRAYSISRTSEPDIALIHFALWPNVIPAMSLRARSGLPYVVIAHGSDARAIGNSRRIRRMAEPLIRNALFTVAVSEELAGILRAAFPGVDIAVIPMGVDAGEFMIDSPAQPPRSPVFMCVGSLNENKNVIYAAECFSKFRKSHPTAELWFAGDGPLLPRLTTLPGVRTLGDVPRAAMPQLMHQVSCGLHVSIHEGFPCAPLEFIASGVPLVSTPNAVSTTMPEEAGYVVPLGDPETTAAAMQRALELRRRSPAALAFAESLSVDAMAESLTRAISARLPT